jgi:hypothetical protein
VEPTRMVEEEASKIVEHRSAEVVSRPQRFVDPTEEPIEVQLSYGDWLQLRANLDYQERENLASSPFKSMRTVDEPGQDKQTEYRLDLATFNIAKIKAWVVDWSFRDKKGNHLDVTEPNIGHLTDETAKEVLEAVDAHTKGIEEKKGLIPLGSPASS